MKQLAALALMMVVVGCSSASMEPDAGSISVDAGISDAAPVEEGRGENSAPTATPLPVPTLPLASCVHGRWLVQFYMSGQSLANGWCSSYEMPSAYFAEVSRDLWFLGCYAAIVSSDGGACVYTSVRTCSPTFNGETFNWYGEVAFHEVSMALPQIINGNIAWFDILGMAGLTNIVVQRPGAPPCEFTVVFTDGVSND